MAPVLVCHVFKGCMRTKRACRCARPATLDIFLRRRLHRDALDARKVDFPMLTARDRALIATAGLLPTSLVYLSVTIVQWTHFPTEARFRVSNVLLVTRQTRALRNAHPVKGGNILITRSRGSSVSCANLVNSLAAQDRTHVMPARSGISLGSLVCLHVTGVPLDASRNMSKL